MRYIIAGSRHIEDYAAVEAAMAWAETSWRCTEVISGAATGVDALGERWAKEHKVPCRRFPADWYKGPRAGPERNIEMARNGDVLVAIWDGVSRGTAHMIKEARARGLKVQVWRWAKIAA